MMVKEKTPQMKTRKRNNGHDQPPTPKEDVTKNMTLLCVLGLFVCLFACLFCVSLFVLFVLLVLNLVFVCVWGVWGDGERVNTAKEYTRNGNNNTLINPKHTKHVKHMLLLCALVIVCLFVLFVVVVVCLFVFSFWCFCVWVVRDDGESETPQKNTHEKERKKQQQQ